jgi:methylenetetrahydrofolate reductase (NADPH)
MSTEQPKIIDLIRANQASGVRSVSFEYFPPKTEKGDETLYAKLEKMAELKPTFIDFTWGAGGTTSDKTPELCLQSMKRFGLVVNMHLTCTNMPKEKVDLALALCKSNGIRNIVALRGDPPVGQTEWKACDSGFACALDLVKYIRANYGDYFCLSVAGYPEGHPVKINESGVCPPEAFVEELDYLKQKVDAGADLIITQLFFDVSLFLNFERRCRDHGIRCPILPGILPMVSYAGLNRMCGFCKTFIPADVKAEVERLKDHESAFRDYGITQAAGMCKAIEAAGMKHFHFYTLNVEYSTEGVMNLMGLKQ